MGPFLFLKILKETVDTLLRRCYNVINKTEHSYEEIIMNASLTASLTERFAEQKLRLEIDLIGPKIIACVYKPTPKAAIFKEKRIWGYSFKSESAMYERVTKYIDAIEEAQRKNAQEKAAKKARQKAEADNVKVGDVFVASWGWEQTNVDCYLVTEKKGVTVTLVEIGVTKIRDNSWASDYVRPDPTVIIDNEPIKKRLQGNRISFGSFKSAMLDDGREYYRSWYA